MQYTIKVEESLLTLNQTPQLYDGMMLRYSGIRKSGAEKWINGAYKSHWIYSFINIETDKIIEFEFDYLDSFVGIYKK